MRLARLLGGFWLALSGCSTLPALELGECGNAVIEGSEACDTFADTAAGEVCRAPGSVGECQFDCRAGSDGERARCPEGRGCAADGICRVHEPGKFEAPVNFSSDASSWVSTTDYDGDRRADIISTEPSDQFQQARFRLHYFDVDAKLVESRTFPRMTTPPLSRDVTGDGRADLIFSNFRVGLIEGRADREFVPASFSSYVVSGAGIRLVGVRGDVVDGASPLVSVTALNGVDGLYTSDSVNGGLVLRAKVPHSLERLAGLVGADLIEGEQSPCDEVVAAYRGDDHFSIYDMCEPGSKAALLSEVVWRPEAIERSVRLPDGLTIDGAPVVADIDADGHLDLVINAGGHPYLVLGDGAGVAPQATNLHLDIDTADGTVGLDSERIIMPLAIGDFSGDGLVDYVVPELLITSHAVDDEVHYVATYQNRGVPWTMALIADLNRNDVVDVVAASEGLTGLSFFNGTASRYAIPTSLPTRGGVRSLTLGDFDGDLVNDLAFMEDGTPESGVDSLSLAFGRGDLSPLTPRRVANLSHVDQLGSFADFGTDALFAASQGRVGDVEQSKVTLFEGGPDRQPIAPYSLVTFSMNQLLQDSLALSVALGAFSGAGSNDVLALGTQDVATNWTLWLLPNIGLGEDPPRQLAAELPSDLVPVDFSREKTLGVKMIAADVDGDAKDEAVAIVSRGDAGCALLVYDVDAVQSTASPRQRLDFSEPCPAPDLVAFDVDRDGSRLDGTSSAVDLLFLRGDSREITILWNDRAGGFSASDRSLVGDGVRAFSPFVQTTSLAYVTRDGLYTATSRGLDRELDDIDRIDGAFHELRSVVVTDPTGDGIEDIAVSDAEGLWLIQAKLR